MSASGKNSAADDLEAEAAEGVEGGRREFGSVAGGGRYDGLISRFTGPQVPATGASSRYTGAGRRYCNEDANLG